MPPCRKKVCADHSSYQMVPHHPLTYTEDDLKNMLRYCDVPTRCRLRRVCHYWKHLTCRPDISDVVLVNPNCMKVSNVERRSQRTVSQAKRSINGGHPYKSSDNIQLGWYYIPYEYTYHKASIDDHDRHGILGSHVRVMIYGSSLPPSNLSADDVRLCEGRIQDIIYSIGLFCTNLERIVLRHVDIRSEEDVNFFTSSPPSYMAAVKSVTVMESTLHRGMVLLPVFPEEDGIYIRTNNWAVRRNIPYENLTVGSRFPPSMCLKNEYEWVAKHAPRLPECYHRWTQLGFTLHRTNVSSYFLPVNLHKIGPDTVKDHDLLLILTIWILMKTCQILKSRRLL